MEDFLGNFASMPIAPQKENINLELQNLRQRSPRRRLLPLHLKAYHNVIEKFRVWEAAFNMTWSQYLVEVQKNSLTGVWAKDVAKYLIEEENQK